MQLTKEQSRQRWRELQVLVEGWDPLGLIAAGAPRGEYDCIIGPVLRHLEQEGLASSLVDYLGHEFAEHFGCPVEQEGIEAFVSRASDWYARRWRGTHG